MSAPVMKGNDAVTGYIISTKLGGKNGEPKLVLQRTSSSGDRDHASKEKAYKKLCCVNINIDRSWSGNLTSPPYEQIENSSIFMPEKKVVKKGPSHRRLMTTGGVAYEGSAEPRLVRSSGMRRDWSFENLSLLRNEKKGRNS